MSKFNQLLGCYTYSGNLPENWMVGFVEANLKRAIELMFPNEQFKLIVDEVRFRDPTQLQRHGLDYMPCVHGDMNFGLSKLKVVDCHYFVFRPQAFSKTMEAMIGYGPTHSDFNVKTVGALWEVMLIILRFAANRSEKFNIKLKPMGAAIEKGIPPLIVWQSQRSLINFLESKKIPPTDLEKLLIADCFGKGLLVLTLLMNPPVTIEKVVTEVLN